jgi:hypothetical protein
MLPSVYPGITNKGQGVYDHRKAVIGRNGNPRGIGIYTPFVRSEMGTDITTNRFII